MIDITNLSSRYVVRSLDSSDIDEIVDLKSTDDGYHLYKTVGFADDCSKYHLMKWKPAELN